MYFRRSALTGGYSRADRRAIYFLDPTDAGVILSPNSEARQKATDGDHCFGSMLAMSSMYLRQLMACAAGAAFLFVTTTAAAHPGGMWGIDVDSVLNVHDQARVLQHQESGDDDYDQLEGIRTIAIDPGHGGDNSGATGVAGIPEKFLSLDLAYDLRDRLQARYPDLRVIMTRYGDESVGLNDRAQMANMAEADLLLSLHYNAAPHDRAIGFETYFLDVEQVTPGDPTPQQGLPVATADHSVGIAEAPIEGTSPIGQNGDTLELIHRDLLRAHRHALSGSLAETIQAQFVDQLDSIDRGVKQGDFTILQGSDMPAVVVEAGFLTHPEEGFEVLSDEHRATVVDSLMDAVEEFDIELANTLEADDEDDADADDPATDDGHHNAGATTDDSSPEATLRISDGQ